jgi:hypothetical protein
MRAFIALFSLFLSSLALGEGRVRHVEVSKDQIVAIHTKVGMATLIQLPERPSSVVIGEQNSFKVEYLDKAITVKPLFSGARTNLYVYTDWYRFNFELLPSAGSKSLDYIVYLKNSITVPSKPQSVRWSPYMKRSDSKSMSVKVTRIGNASDGTVLIDFIVTSKQRREFKPEWLWITENGNVRPIQSLFLSRATCDPLTPISGVVTLKKSDFARDVGIQLEIRIPEKMAIKIPRTAVWN